MEQNDPVEAVLETVEQALKTPMGRKARRVWPDIFNLAIGAWMVLSAFVPMFSGPHAGALAAGLTGALVAAISFAGIQRVEHWKEALNLALGLWLVAAPFVLGFGSTFNPTLNFVSDGGLLVLHSAYQVLRPPWRRKGRL